MMELFFLSYEYLSRKTNIVRKNILQFFDLKIYNSYYSNIYSVTVANQTKEVLRLKLATIPGDLIISTSRLHAKMRIPERPLMWNKRKRVICMKLPSNLQVASGSLLIPLSLSLSVSLSVSLSLSLCLSSLSLCLHVSLSFLSNPLFFFTEHILDPGKHCLNIMWDGKNIPGSPAYFNVKGPAPARLCYILSGADHIKCKKGSISFRLVL